MSGRTSILPADAGPGKRLCVDTKRPRPWKPPGPKDCPDYRISYHGGDEDPRLTMELRSDGA